MDRLVIEPEHGVRAVDGILTGFHDRDSSHLQMLEAIAGPALIERTYRAATEAGYLRHEFGDLALIDPSRGESHEHVQPRKFRRLFLAG